MPDSTVDQTGDSVGGAAPRDVLVSRIVDGAATPEDWASLRTLASTDPTVWADLSETQGAHERLSAAVGEAIAIADSVELPAAAPDHEGVGRRLELVRSWGGWAAAAMLAVVWWTGVPVQTGAGGGGGVGGATGASRPMTAGTGGPTLIDPGPSSTTADDALRRYIDLGRAEGSVIAAMPEEVVLETRSLGNGSAEVLYLRQILERRVVDEFYRLGTDDLGRPVPVRDVDAGAASSPF